MEHHHRLGLAAAAGALAAGIATYAYVSYGGGRSRRSRQRATGDVVMGFPGLIGNTPMVEIRSLSAATGCRILAKAEFLNPGGSTKDRIAREMVEEAEAAGKLCPGGTIVEGTSGSTGISLAFMAKARGYRCVIVMPDDVAAEKAQVLRESGAEVREVRPASIVNGGHYCNVAAALAEQTDGAFFADQFETPANFNAHYLRTGPEIWEQTDGGKLDAFVMSAGTGGTIAGVSCFLKERLGDEGVRVFLADPPGSSLYHSVLDGVCYAPEQAERRVRRHRYDTIAEGIGLDRLTANFKRARIDDAFRVTDREAVEMAHYLLREEGLFVGSSSAVNLVATVRAARKMGKKGATLVTVLCDSGQRHLTKFWNPSFLEKWRLTPRAKGLEFLDGL